MTITLTPVAAARIKQRAPRSEMPCIRFGARKTGCSGFSYVVEFLRQPEADDHLFRSHGVEIAVAPQSLPMLQGACIDFRKTGITEMFHFDNPNATAHCGCGESFTTD